jgi:transaldolase/glucose-6-phosphate isomerase
MSPLPTSSPRQPSRPSKNPLRLLEDFGQAPWLDSIQRSFTRNGSLKKLVDEDGLKGVTSNPTIFEKSIGSTREYDEMIGRLAAQNIDANGIYESLIIADIQDAADVLLPVYQKSQGQGQCQGQCKDGFVSLEVSPKLANDAEATIQEAKRLWRAVDKPNLMIKVPGTLQGVFAFRELISQGINVNVTLLFSRERHEQVMEAYFEGLERLASAGGDLGKVASVASFFVSRIDTAVDEALAQKFESEVDPNSRAHLSILMGKVAIANARLAYKCFQHLFSTARWKKLALQGAKVQRVLWASTSTKNPAYKDVLYVEELIGKDTVNTLPKKTLEAFREHGNVRNSVTEDLSESESILEDLEKAGVSLEQITEKLLTNGISDFAQSYTKLLNTIEQKRQVSLKGKQIQVLFNMNTEDRKNFDEATIRWEDKSSSTKLWNKDPSLWTGHGEEKWMGWLDVIDRQLERLNEFKRFADEVKAEGFQKILLLGMGGSSLCPEVLSKTFSGIQLEILDSTDPARILTLQNSLPFQTLFIVSSKSGSTLEPHLFLEYFYDMVEDGSRFVAITDPGSALEMQARKLNFRRIFYGEPSIGGRYSALSDFGAIPGAAMGMNVDAFLTSALLMERSCAEKTPAQSNPGVSLGIFLGTLALSKRDKLTLLCSPALSDLGAWIEQLIAESTGKQGRGIIPIAGEKASGPESYDNDRLFAYFHLESDSSGSSNSGGSGGEQEAKVSALEKAGYPVVRIQISNPEQLGQVFFLWEMATAVAGSIIGINPFDQPDVEASKVETRKMMDLFTKKGELPHEDPIFSENDICIFADEKNAREIFHRADQDKNLEGLIRAHLSRLCENDYFAILAYIEMSEENRKLIQKIRMKIRDRYKIATCVGFGPRFLHSTGQAYKGGPNSGVFVQITCENSVDLPLPKEKYSFAIVKSAQARGDFQVLCERGRRVLRIHISRDIQGDLTRILNIIERITQ